MTEADILKLIESDPWMMNALREAEGLGLRDWVIGAGFVRNKVWDALHGIERMGVDANDVDLVYFDTAHQDWAADRALSAALTERTGIKWEVRNQCYMHEKDNLPPYLSLEDALSRWTETATGIGVRLKEGQLSLVAPHGLEDLVNLVVRPSPSFAHRADFIRGRAATKRWLEKWPKLKLVL
jgi:hypothetical protein